MKLNPNPYCIFVCFVGFVMYVQVTTNYNTDLKRYGSKRTEFMSHHFQRGKKKERERATERERRSEEMLVQ